MGTSRTYKYRIEIRKSNEKKGFKMTPWGADKLVNLKDFCEHYEKSEHIGGVNAHISKDRGWLLSIDEAVMIRQSDNKVVQHYKAAPFRLF